MTDSPGSPLSSIPSDDMSDHDDMKPSTQGNSPSASSTMPNMPPSKRRRTGFISWDQRTPASSHQGEPPAPPSPTSTISSDTSGELPNSPGFHALVGQMQDDDYSGQAADQVTICRWDGCTLHDLGNMDDLVRHIHDDHIGPKPKRYTCEWIDCARKGQTHASGYALRAHMRSHTREKPFFCSVPECDRSFTRSDALTKHMRTVHEPDTPRPAEKQQVQRIKLKLSQPKDESAQETQTQTHQQDPQSHPDTTTTPLDTTPGGETIPLEEIDLPESAGPELGFDAHELSLPPRDLYRILRRQIHWAEKEGQQLRTEWDGIRPQRKQMWMEKEAISDDAADAEMRLFKILMDGESAVPDAAAAAAAATADADTSGQLEKPHPAYQPEPEAVPDQQRYLGVDVQPNPA